VDPASTPLYMLRHLTLFVAGWATLLCATSMRRVAMAANGQWAPGFHSVAFCPRDCGMVPGTYFVVLSAEQTRKTTKLVVTP
jgi:hypothetical protein